MRAELPEWVGHFAIAERLGIPGTDVEHTRLAADVLDRGQGVSFFERVRVRRCAVLIVVASRVGLRLPDNADLNDGANAAVPVSDLKPPSFDRGRVVPGRDLLDGFMGVLTVRELESQRAAADEFDV